MNWYEKDFKVRKHVSIIWKENHEMEIGRMHFVKANTNMLTKGNDEIIIFEWIYLS